jgi:acylphosphatase
MPDNENQRVHILVKGRVQGVAFRAHVEYFALQIGVSGWVRNAGKDVETVAEGDLEQIKKFIEIVKQGSRASRVDETAVTNQAATGEFDGFIVKHSV